MTPGRARELSRWHGMLRRCEDPRHTGYRYYGGRGIKVCGQWHDFETFYADIMRLLGPCPPGHSIDRIDNDGNYEPGNVQWATPPEQFANSRANIHGRPPKPWAPPPQPEPEPDPRRFQFVKPSEVCAALGASHGEVLLLIHAGELEAIRIGRHFRVKEVSVEEYVSRHLPEHRAVNQ